MAEDKPWWFLFTFARDGITGSELLGIALVLGMVIILCIVQYGERNEIDFSWVFADDKTGKVSRSGLLVMGGFLLGCWVIVDAQSNGKLDWGSFTAFLSYCAGVRVIEAFKPKDEPPLGKTIETLEKTKTTEVVAPPANPLTNKEP